MSSNDEKIGKYEQEKENHKAEIQEIKNGEGLYSELSNKEKLNAIKSKEDAIHDCEVAIDRLRQQQMPGKWMILLIFCFILLTCLRTIQGKSLSICSTWLLYLFYYFDVFTFHVLLLSLLV